MPLLADLKQTGGGYFLYNLIDPPDVVTASGAGATATTSASTGVASTGPTGAGVTDAATAASGSAVGYAISTVVLPVYNGIGSIFYGYGEAWGHFTGSPQAGDTIRYPTTNGFRILPDGTIEAAAYGTYTYYYNDGSGEVARTLVIDGSIQVFPAGATATATASTASEYGGVNIEGDAPDVTATPASGNAATGNIATGAGPTATTSSPGASVQGNAAAAGAGPSATATPSTGVGENIVSASGAGASASASAAQGSASGDVYAVGAGAVATASPGGGAAVGDRLPGSIPYGVLTVVYPSTLLDQRVAA